MRKLFALLALTGMLSLAAVQPAYAAFDPFEQACTMEGGQSTVCQDRGSPENPAVSTLQDVTTIIAIVTGIAAVIMIIIGGIKYILADGDSSKITSAKNTILYALVGLVVIVLARALIIFVVNRV